MFQSILGLIGMSRARTGFFGRSQPSAMAMGGRRGVGLLAPLALWYGWKNRHAIGQYFSRSKRLGV